MQIPETVIELSLTGAAATQALGYRLGEFLPAGTVILLQGDLGSGKTTLIQGLGAGLGITAAIASPTFTLICEYPEGRVPLYHFDLYRLNPQDIATLLPELYWEGLEVDPGIVAIEWAERLPYLPSRYLEVQLQYPEFTPETESLDEFGYPSRRVTLRGIGLELDFLGLRSQP